MQDSRLNSIIKNRKDPDQRDLKNEDYDPAGTFKDYDPQLNLMPRLAFSFPISESAGFFAHYDVLVERPNSNTLVAILDSSCGMVDGSKPLDTLGATVSFHSLSAVE